MGKETACTIGHKYGEDAEKVADDALVAAGHTVNIAAVRKQHGKLYLSFYIIPCTSPFPLCTNVVLTSVCPH